MGASHGLAVLTLCSAPPYYGGFRQLTLRFEAHGGISWHPARAYIDRSDIIANQDPLLRGRGSQVHADEGYELPAERPGRRTRYLTFLGGPLALSPDHPETHAFGRIRKSFIISPESTTCPAVGSSLCTANFFCAASKVRYTLTNLR